MDCRRTPASPGWWSFGSLRSSGSVISPSLVGLSAHSFITCALAPSMFLKMPKPTRRKQDAEEEDDDSDDAEAGEGRSRKCAALHLHRTPGSLGSSAFLHVPSAQRSRVLDPLDVVGRDDARRRPCQPRRPPL